jgi:uncharacterized coiled-coil protein SlyX
MTIHEFSLDGVRAPRANGAAREPSTPDVEQMDQIRELLFGDQQRHLEARIAALETRTATIEQGLIARIDSLQAQLDALVSGVETDRRTDFAALAAGLTELAEQVRNYAR